MTNEQRSELKKLILQTKKDIKQEIEKLEEKVEPIEPDCSLGRLTRLEAMQEKSINEAVLEKVKIRLKKIEFVINKIDSDEFGICSICEEEIPYGRLKIVPESTICIECANTRN